MELASSVVKSNKGINAKVYHGGYEYIQDGRNKLATVFYYCCLFYKSMKCPGRLIRDTSKPVGEQLKLSKEHTHAPDGRSIGVSLVNNNLKRKAASSNDTPRNIVGESTAEVDVATKAMLPLMSSLDRKVRRIRKDNTLPALPANLTELVIPDELKLFKEEPFLLYDSGSGTDRFMIFSTPSNLNYLRSAEVWLMDGTFDIVPPLFHQIYTIQGRINGWYVPLVYILSSNKKKSTYEKAFREILKSVPNMKPSHIITDFEIEAINAAKLVFPSAILHGCFFHLGQSIWRHIQNIGLQVKYINDSEFALHVRELACLAFLPAEDIPKAFSKLCESPFWTEREDEDSLKLQDLLLYFKTTYIGLELGNKSRRTPLFPPTLWSVFDITKLGYPRTKSSMEAWHGLLAKSIGTSHVSIFKFILALKSEQQIQLTRMGHIDAGRDPEKRPAKYVKMEKRLLNTLETYNTTEQFNLFSYLTTLSHNVEL